jgi:hypothetical protein
MIFGFLLELKFSKAFSSHFDQLQFEMFPILDSQAVNKQEEGVGNLNTFVLLFVGVAFYFYSRLHSNGKLLFFRKC